MYEIKLVMVREKVDKGLPDDLVIDTPTDVYNLMNPVIGNLPHECLYAIFLTKTNLLIGIHLVSKGTIDGCTVPARDIFTPALLCNASKIIVVHNHPSGSLEVSEGDKRFTSNIVEASKIMEVPVVDHVIIAAFEAGYTSLRKDNVVDFCLP